MKDRPHWSYSALTQYLRCPLQYFFQRVMKLKPEFTPSGLVMGAAVHQALAYYHYGLKENSPVAKEKIHAEFIGCWQQRSFQERIQMQAGQTESDVVDQGIALLDAYLREPPPENIVSIEQELIVPLISSDGEVLEKPLVTVVDLATQPSTGFRITDFKTSSRSYSEFEATVSLQANCYLHAAHESFGVIPAFEYVVLTKTKVPRVQRLETTRTTADFTRLGDLVKNVDRAVEGGIFYPIENPLNCSGCPFRKPCRQWQGSRMHFDTRPEKKPA